jgi:putative ABC transport system substrate-binding protein
MRRREFLTLVSGAAAAWPLAARAQQPAMPVVGYLQTGTPETHAIRSAAFVKGLGEAGYVEGRNVAIERRWSNGQLDHARAMLVDLLGHKITVLAMGVGTTAVREAMARTTAVPIVFTTAADPVERGRVERLNRPGGNVTGVTWINSELEPKQLELLHQAVPGAVRIAVLSNGALATNDDEIGRLQLAARTLGLEIILVNAGTRSEIENAFATAVEAKAAAMQVRAVPLFSSETGLIAALALRHRLPTVIGNRDAAATGFLMSYAASIPDSYRLAGVYVGRILKGERPADLPVLRPTRFELVINLKTAKTLDIAVPPGLLAIADEVIE